MVEPVVRDESMDKALWQVTFGRSDRADWLMVSPWTRRCGRSPSGGPTAPTGSWFGGLKSSRELTSSWDVCEMCVNLPLPTGASGDPWRVVRGPAARPAHGEAPCVPPTAARRSRRPPHQLQRRGKSLQLSSTMGKITSGNLSDGGGMPRASARLDPPRLFFGL